MQQVLKSADAEKFSIGGVPQPVELDGVDSGNPVVSGGVDIHRPAEPESGFFRHILRNIHLFVPLEYQGECSEGDHQIEHAGIFIEYNEQAVVSVGITTTEVTENKELKLDVTGVAFLMTRVNVVQPKKFNLRNLKDEVKENEI